MSGFCVFPEGEEVFVSRAGALTLAALASAPGEVLACKAFARAKPRCANARRIRIPLSIVKIAGEEQSAA